MSTLNSGKFPPPPLISTLDYTSAFILQGTGLSGQFYPTANKAYYIPVLLTYTVIATKLFCINDTAVAGNIDLGIYNIDGTRIVSTGSTAQAGTSQSQSISITPTTLGPGLIYLAIASSSTSAAFVCMKNAAAHFAQFFGGYEQLTALPLPAAATFASSSSFFVPLIGFTVAPNTLV